MKARARIGSARSGQGLRCRSIMSATIWCSLPFISCILALPSPALGAYFQGLGDLPGGAFESEPDDVSADGTVVVGVSMSASGREAFRWRAGDPNGMVGLGDFPGGIFFSEAWDTSSDGSVVVGGGNITGAAGAFRWTVGDPPLSDPNSTAGLGGSSAVATGVSSDGTVVVGFTRPFPTEAFRWELGDPNGVTGLGTPPVEGWAFDVSADGTVIVGSFSSGSLEPFRWVQGDPNGIVGLGSLSDPAVQGQAFAVSADGTMVVGFSFNGSVNEAFRWELGDPNEMVGLGTLGGTSWTEANDVSANGSIIVGSSFDPNHAVLWDESSIAKVQDRLVACGLNLTGWTLEEADGISDDGLTIVGSGNDPNGNTQAWVANLSGCAPTAVPALRGSWSAVMALLLLASALVVVPTVAVGARPDSVGDLADR